MPKLIEYDALQPLRYVLPFPVMKTVQHSLVTDKQRRRQYALSTANSLETILVEPMSDAELEAIETRRYYEREVDRMRTVDTAFTGRAKWEGEVAVLELVVEKLLIEGVAGVVVEFHEDVVFDDQRDGETADKYTTRNIANVGNRVRKALADAGYDGKIAMPVLKDNGTPVALGISLLKQQGAGST